MLSRISTHRPFLAGLGWILTLLTGNPCMPQSHQNFTHLSVNNGLSQSTVFAISQDAKGFMWFGTRGGGLNQYDGYEFHVYQHIPEIAESLSDNTVNAILEDSSKRLWIGTRDGGINRYDLATGKFKMYNPQRPGVLNPDAPVGVLTLFEDSRGTLWVGTKFGAFVYDEAADRFEDGLREVPFPVKGVTGICEDARGRLYFATWDRLISYHPEEKDYRQLEYPEDPFGVFGGRINPMLLDSRNTLWVGTPEGIKTIDLHEGFAFSAEAYPGLNWPASFGYIRSILESKDGLIWFGSEDGLYALDPVQGELMEYKTDPGNPNSLVHNSIYSLYEDMAGTLWVGTWSGISVLDKRRFAFQHYQHLHNDVRSLSNNIVSSFQEAPGGTWIGTEQGGLNFMNAGATVFTAYGYREGDPESLPSNNVKSVYTDSNGDLWVGTYTGGLSLHRGNGRFTHFLPGHSIYSMAEMPGKKLYVGSMSGLYVMDLNTREISNEVFPVTAGTTVLNSFIISLFRDSRDRLWIGTRNEGAYLLDAGRKTVDWFESADQDTSTLIGNYVITFCEDHQQRIWIGTSRGLSSFNETSRDFQRIDQKAGFPAGVINGVLADEAGALWISTNNGIFHLDPASGEYRQYDYLDGLQSNEFNRGACYMNSRGEMFFGGVLGFNVFRPEEIKTNPDPPPVIISDLKLFNKSVVAGEEDSPLDKHISDMDMIRLTHRQSSFSLEFVALNYLLPEKNSYAYMLEGYEEDWNYSGRSRTASYMNLDPGSYAFRVKASNNDNVWNEQGASLEIVVLGPPWTSPAAFFIYALVIAVLMIILVKTVSYRTNKENELRLERTEKDKLRELNRMRLQFFTNISHEFRTPLTLIAGPLDKLSSGNYRDQESYLLGLMRTNVNRMLRLVNQLMDFRKLENEKMHLRVSQGKLDAFLSQIVLGFEDLASSKMIELKLNTTRDVPEDREQWFDEGIMDKVVYNLLSNAFKFTDIEGIVEVSLHLEEKEASIGVKDTGKGIEPNKVKRIFERFYSESPEVYSGTGIGLSLSKKLIDLHRGSISVDSEKGQGATFLVRIPVHREAFSEEELDKEKRDVVYNRPGLDPDPLSPVIAGSGNKGSGRGKLILIAEDNPELSSYLAGHFAGYQVMLCANGKEALELARKKMPDIVVSDIMMPEMDGIELCRKLKSEFLTSHIPVVLLSAKAAVDEKIEGMATGADAYLEKPFDPDYLSAIVKNLLEQREKLRQKFSGSGHPDPNQEALGSTERLFMDKVNGIITANLADTAFSVDQLLQEIGMSRSQLYRKFKAISDRNPSEYIRMLRLQHALELLKKKDHTVNEVAYMSGFSNVSYFNTCFKRHFGKSPGKYLDTSP